MEDNFTETKKTDLDKSIEKAIKKYTLEVDDAIEAYGFKAASYIDFAEDSISELGNSIKQQFREKTPSLLFTNLADSLNTTTKNIIDHTIENASFRNNNFSNEKLEQKAFELHNVFGELNSRFLNNLEKL